MSKTILAVDDSPSIRQLMMHTLRGGGYTVLQAANGEEGLAKAKAAPVSLVLTDQNMPTMDGLTLIKSLRRLREYRTVPILMLTAESDEDMKAQGRAAGANGWVVKPFNPSRLLEVVGKVLG